MDVSVIISTWNNSERLRRTLEALTRCHVHDALNWELVLINNNCTDETDAVAAAFRERLPLVYDHESTPGKSRAQNRALERARGTLILFTDDDVVPSTDWIDLHWQAYQARSSGFFFGGPVASAYEGDAPDAALRRIAPPSVRGLDFGLQARILDARAPFIGANWSAPAATLRAVGGFDVDMGPDPTTGEVRVGEESELMGRLSDKGLQAWYIPEARLQHMVPAEKCTHEHIVGRRIAQARNEALTRYGPVRPRRFAAARAMGRAGWLWLRARIAPLVGRTGLLSYAKYRGYGEAVKLLVRQKH